MKSKNAIYLIGLGIGSTLLYQNIKNGNLRKWTRQMNQAKTEMLEDLEDMIVDAISEEVGWLVNYFEYVIIEE